MTKRSKLEIELEKILKNYYYDQYNKGEYYKNCIKAIMKLVQEQLKESERETAIFVEGFFSSYCFHHKLNSEDCEECGRSRL